MTEVTEESTEFNPMIDVENQIVGGVPQIQDGNETPQKITEEESASQKKVKNFENIIVGHSEFNVPEFAPKKDKSDDHLKLEFEKPLDIRLESSN